MTSAGDKGIGIKGWLSGQKPRTRTTEVKPEPIVLDKHRVAVLPFANISPDPNDGYFADGLTEELMSRLSELRELKVIARTSAMSYKGTQKKASEIGKELSVGSIVEGSVRKAGNKIRVNVQLVDADTEERLWAYNYDRELDDVFMIQADIASKVADSLPVGGSSRALQKDTDDTEAYTLYMRATQLLHESTEPSLREAVTLFGHAISRDPKFVKAFASLSEAWAMLAVGGYEDFSVVAGKAEPAARKALELGPDLAESHSAIAGINSMLDRFAESVSEAEKAIQLNPNLSGAYHALGANYSSLGMLDKGLTAFKKMFELDPLSVHAALHVAEVSSVAGRMNEAIMLLSKMRELNPRNPLICHGLAKCFIIERNYAEAQNILNIGMQISPKEPWLKLVQGMLYALTGRRKEAQETLQSILGEEVESVRLDAQLFIQAALGNLDEAFRALMRQAETHSWHFLIKYLPVFEDLRKDKRFAEFCMKVGLPV